MREGRVCSVLWRPGTEDGRAVLGMREARYCGRTKKVDSSKGCEKTCVCYYWGAGCWHWGAASRSTEGGRVAGAGASRHARSFAAVARSRRERARRTGMQCAQDELGDSGLSLHSSDLAPSTSRRVLRLSASARVFTRRAALRFASLVAGAFRPGASQGIPNWPPTPARMTSSCKRCADSTTIHSTLLISFPARARP